MTLIVLDNKLASATVLTDERSRILELERAARKYPGVATFELQSRSCCVCHAPANWVHLYAPAKLTPEERQNRSDRMIATLEKRRTRNANKRSDDCVDCPPPHTDADCPPEPCEDTCYPYEDLEP